MERCKVWAVIGEDVSRWQKFRGREFRPRGVIGFLVMGEGPVLFTPGGIAPTGQPEFKCERITKAIEGLLLRPILASGEPDTSDAGRGGAMFVNGTMRVMDLASFKAAMDAYYKSETARMPDAKTSHPGGVFRAAALEEIKSGHRKPLQRILQLAGMTDAKDYSTTAA